MRALTLHQPWAWAIAHKNKRVANRTWLPPRNAIGMRIAIHAGKTFDKGGCAWMYEHGVDVRDARRADTGIVAVARLLGWASIYGPTVRYGGEMIDPERLGEWVDSHWFRGPVGWLLDDVHALDVPVRCSGAQGLWALPPDIEAEVMRQIGKAAT